MSFQRRATELAAAGAGGGSQDDADALMALCHHLLGDTSAGVHDALGALDLGAAVPGPASPADAALFDHVCAIGRRQPGGGDPGRARARGTRRDRRFR